MSIELALLILSIPLLAVFFWFLIWLVTYVPPVEDKKPVYKAGDIIETRSGMLATVTSVKAGPNGRMIEIRPVGMESSSLLLFGDGSDPCSSVINDFSIVRIVNHVNYTV